MSDMDSLTLLGGLGGPELILIAAIVLLLAGVSRLTRLQEPTRQKRAPVSDQVMIHKETER